MLSVIIPTRNRAALLHKALESFRHQTLPADAFELIVVDNGSTDETAVVCREAQDWFNSFVYDFAPMPGLHVGRHRGLKLSRGDILVYGDDDIRAAPTWLAAIHEAFDRPEVGLVGGKCLPDYEVPPPAWEQGLWNVLPEGRLNTFYSLVDLGDKGGEIPAHYVFGCNFSIRKSLLLKAGGFHPDGMPQDLLQYRGDGETAVSLAVEALGYRAWYSPEAAVYHHVSARRMTPAYIGARAFSQGVSDSYTRLRAKRGGGALESWLFHVIKSKAYAAFLSESLLRVRKVDYHAGFAWHSRQIMQSAELRDWVVKVSYLDEDQQLYWCGLSIGSDS